MDWWREAALWVPPVLTLIGIRWQFVGARERNNAKAMASHEQAISSAEARNDPIADAYRSHAYAHLQSMHRTKPAAGMAAIAWAVVAVASFGLVFTVEPGYATTQVVVMVGTMASFVMVLKNWGDWWGGERRLDHNLTESIEQAMVAARQAFIDARGDEDPRPTVAGPHERIASWYQAKNPRERAFVRASMVSSLAAFTVFVAILQMTQGDQVDVDRWMSRMAWWTTTAVGAAPLWSRTLRGWIALVAAGFSARYIFALTQLIWAFVWVGLLRPHSSRWFVWILKRDEPVEAFDVAGFAAALTLLGCLIWFVAWYDRVKRIVKQASRP